MRAKVLLGLAAVVLSACGGGATATPAQPGERATTTASVTPTSSATTQPTTVPGGTASDLAPLNEARSRWAAANMSTFSYVFEDDCGECMPVSQQVVVWDGVLASGGEPVPSIEAMFDAIESAIADGQAVDVVYDDELGFPVDLWIDREARAYDGGIHWLIEGFSGRLPGDGSSLDGLDAAEARWQAMRPLAYSFRTTIICDCELDGWLRTRVEGVEIVDWEMDLTVGDSASFSPLTVDELLADLRELFSAGVEQQGVRVGGSAEYHPELGYPVWVGLDIEVLDPESELADLPPRLIFSIDQFNAEEPSGDLGSATNLDEFQVARERWVATGLVDYQYSLTVHDILSGDYSDPYTVIVLDGAVATVTAADNTIDDPELPALPINDLFDRIEVWSQSGTPADVIYHEVLGYPVVVVRRSGDTPLAFSISDLVER
jgi:hypothetical protein